MDTLFTLLRSPLFAGSVVMVGGSLLSSVINYLYHLSMGKVLDPVEYGVLASIFSILYMASIIPLSTSIAIVKFTSSAKSTEELSATFTSIRKFILKVAIAGSIILILLTPSMLSFLHIKDYVAVLFVAPCFFLSLIVLVNQSTSQGTLKFFGVVVPMLVSSIAKLVLGILFVWLGYSVSGAMFALVIAILLSYFVSLRYVRNIKESESGSIDLTSFIKFSGPALVQSFAFTSLFTVDLILVKHFLPEFDAGIYAALSTLGKIIFFAASPVSQVMFPVVSKRVAQGEHYRRILLLAIIMNVGISLFILALYTLFPVFIVTMLYKDRYIQAAPYLSWMALFMLVYTVSQLIFHYMLSIGKTKTVILPFIAAIIQIILIVMYHESILQVIQVSLLSVSILLVLCLVLLFKFEMQKQLYGEKA